MPCEVKRSTNSLKKSKFSFTFQPAFEVIASGASGTKVTCVGFTLQTKSMNLSQG